MGSIEYRELKQQMDRIERLLAKMAGAPVDAAADLPVIDRPAPVSEGISERERTKAHQKEGHYILATQGFDAYKKFWKEQAKKDRQPRRSRREAA
jgi:hypothetical protein